MSDPLGFFLMLGVAVFGITLGFVVLRRARCIALVESLQFSRTESPLLFWYGIALQRILGLVCLVAAVGKLFE